MEELHCMEFGSDWGLHRPLRLLPEFDRDYVFTLIICLLCAGIYYVRRYLFTEYHKLTLPAVAMYTPSVTRSIRNHSSTFHGTLSPKGTDCIVHALHAHLYTRTRKLRRTKHHPPMNSHTITAPLPHVASPAEYRHLSRPFLRVRRTTRRT